MASIMRKPSASVIFFHGSGDTGPNVLEWVRGLIGRDFNGSHIKYVFPTAPMQEYTPFDGEMSTVWFNRESVDIAAGEDRSSMSQSYDIAKQLIQHEVDQGIPHSRIIVGGFSMGGALALHTGYHVTRNLAGVFAHSSFLNRKSVVYESVEAGSTLPELCMFHGEDDKVVEFQWGRETFDRLQELGVIGTFTSLNDTAHELKKSSILEVEQWILKKLP
ncbi:lysophospholipase-like protein 1 [Drosophila montana]|uniref:lysophospholipase-like protein 1 n=1 Tax=Drosophila montana TaxID=40370 RepID=UPI00313DAEA2